MLVFSPMLFAQDVNEDEDVVYVEVQKSPEFEGGVQRLYEFLGNQMSYPKKAKKKGVQGRVILQFVVERDGSVSDVEVVKGVDKDLDKEAVRVVKLMPRWVPGEMDGEPVRVKYTLPILFRISE